MFSVPHRIERSTNRSSRAFLEGDTIVIRLAKRLTKTEEHKHIESLLRRMTKIRTKLASLPLINPFHTSPKELHRSLWKELSQSRLQDMTQLVHAINARTLRVPVGRISLRLTTSKWGSCSPSGNISLSTALLFVPEPLQDYVIVHELAHIVHRNHSRKFWETVESVMPDYRERRKELRRYRLPRI